MWRHHPTSSKWLDLLLLPTVVFHLPATFRDIDIKPTPKRPPEKIPHENLLIQ